MTADEITIRQWHQDVGSTHSSCFRWLRTVGFARHDGVSVTLREAPAITGDDIEFFGGAIGRVDSRDMTPDEVLAVRRLLRQMAGEAQDALCGFSTLVVIDRAAG